MNWIIASKRISEKIVKVDVKAPEIAEIARPGHHVYVTVDEGGNRFPIVISKLNKTRGTISLFVQLSSKQSRELADKVVGDELFNVSGPFGEPVEARKVGTVLCAAGGQGIAPLYPVVAAMKEAGNKVIVALGARTSEYLILEEEIRQLADELIVMTDDGSCGREGMVTEAMHTIFSRENIDLVVTYGPIRMIKHSSTLTHMLNIPIIATLYILSPSFKNGVGIFNVSMCTKSKYVCVDGENYNGVFPDFDTLIRRMDHKLSGSYDGDQSYSKPIFAMY